MLRVRTSFESGPVTNGRQTGAGMALTAIGGSSQWGVVGCSGSRTLFCNVTLYTETSRLRTLKIMPTNIKQMYFHEFGFWSCMPVCSVEKLRDDTISDVVLLTFNTAATGWRVWVTGLVTIHATTYPHPWSEPPPPPHLLKGQCHEIFCFWFFSWISFPPAPEYTIRTVSNFFENSRRYSQVKVHHWRQILPTDSLVLLIPVANFANRFASVVDTGGKFATGVNDTGGK